MAFLGGLFGGGGEDPSKKAMPYFNEAKQYFTPYINAAQKFMPIVEGQYSNLLNDPTAIMNKIGAGYQASPGYNWQVGQMTNAANRAAAAGGMLGSPAEQQMLSQNIQGLASQDYNNYLNRGLGLYNTGLQGYGGLNNMYQNFGFNASENIANLLQNQAQLAYAGQANKNQSQGGLFGGIVGGIANALF